jgi:hypothetical protein
MTKKSKIVGNELVLTAKAIRRGEKLERTLTKLVAISEPQSHAEAFLKAVQKGLARLRTDETSLKDEGKSRTKKSQLSGEQKPKDDTPAPVVVKRVPRKTKSDTLVATEPEVAQADQ